MRWLEIYVPEPGWVCMRRSDGRFGKISVKLIDYDFDTAGEYTGRELDAALDMIRAMAQGQRMSTITRSCGQRRVNRSSLGLTKPPTCSAKAL